MTPPDSDHTYATRFRIPKRMWDAYGRVTERLGTDRSARLLDAVRTDIKTHGNEQDLADLAAAEQELAERRSRKGGRPPKPAALSETPGVTHPVSSAEWTASKMTPTPPEES